MKPRGLRAHHNVIPLADIAEERRLREQERAAHLTEAAVRVNMGVPPGFVPMFIGFRAAEPENALQAAPERRQRLGWLRTIMGLVKRSRPS